MSTLSSFNPLDGTVVGEVTMTPVEDIPDLVSRARAAQPDWMALGLEGRAELLAKSGPQFGKRAKELGTLITREMGKPLSESTPEARAIGSGMKGELAEIVEALQPETFRQGSIASTVHQDPFGVCAAITPWNFPMAMPVGSLKMVM